MTKATRTRRRTPRRKKPSVRTAPSEVIAVDTATPPVFGISRNNLPPEDDASIEDALEDWPESADAPDEWIVERHEAQEP